MEGLLLVVLKQLVAWLLLLHLLPSKVLMVDHFRAEMQMLYIVQMVVPAVEVVDIMVVPAVSEIGVVLHILEILMVEAVADIFIRV